MNGRWPQDIDVPRLWRMAGWFGVAFTLVISLMPPSLDTRGGHVDKLVHALGYALLMFWWAQLVIRHRFMLAVAIIVFGALIELLQGLTPDRLPDPLDALANSGGVLLGWLAARLLPNLPGHLAALPALRR